MTWKTIPAHGKLCQYVKNDNRLYLFFRGTGSKQEWIYNCLPFFTREIGGYWVDILDDRQARDVLDAMPPDFFDGVDQVIIGGLSRGYAIAVCVAIRLQGMGMQIDYLVGFAGKRTLAPFSKLPPLPAENLYRAGDIVPYLPPWYRRAGIDKAHGSKIKTVAAHWEAYHMAIQWRQSCLS
jgi:hypothetical protein